MALDWMPIVAIGSIKAGMLNVDDYLQIRLLHRDGLSIREIAKRLGHGRDTVKKALVEATPRGYTRTRPAACPKLGPFVGVIDAILAQDEAAPVKQRHTAMQVYRRLVAEHAYRGGYDQVRRHVARQRRDRRQTLIPLRHEPGERIECDFGQVRVDFPDGRRPVDVLVMVWSFSHAPFMTALPNQRTESVLTGMTAGLHFLGRGRPRGLVGQPQDDRHRDPAGPGARAQPRLRPPGQPLPL